MVPRVISHILMVIPFKGLACANTEPGSGSCWLDLVGSRSSRSYVRDFVQVRPLARGLELLGTGEAIFVLPGYNCGNLPYRDGSTIVLPHEYGCTN